MSYFSYSENLPQWIGKLPDSWKSDWIKWNTSLSTKRPSEDEQSILPYISNEDIESWTGKLLRDELKPSESDSRVFKKNDILFNKLRPYLAKVFHATFNGVSSGELLCLRPAEQLDPRFLFYVLVSKGFIDAINSETFGSKMPRADWEIVGHQPLPLPPLAIQQRITAFLDEKTAQIDGLIEKKRALLEGLTEKRQALITQTVTKGLNPDAPMKPSGIDWLGEIPAHWEVAPLRRIAHKVSTGRTPPSSGPNYFGEDICWFTPGDFKGSISLGESTRKISDDAIIDGVASLYPKGTIYLVSIGATLGKVAVGTCAGSANQQINAIQLEKDQNPYFLAYFLHVFRNEVRVISNGNTLGILNQNGTKSLPILKVPEEEQDCIASQLIKYDESLNSQVGLIQESIDYLAEYRSALITAAVTGQIEGLQ